MARGVSVFFALTCFAVSLNSDSIFFSFLLFAGNSFYFLHGKHLNYFEGIELDFGLPLDMLLFI